MSEFKPLHPKFVGKARIARSDKYNSNHQPFYEVNLAAGECSCQWGKPFATYNGKLYPNAYCTHKLKAIADIVKRNPDDDLQWYYVKALATRYNVWEVVSAFHKELRRADFDNAFYWAMMLSNFRGNKGLLKRMIDIVYEETREHELFDYLLDLYEKEKAKKLELADICKGVKFFCEAPKKWELSHRMSVFEAEMTGYQQLAKKFTYQVKEGRDIIPEKHNEDLIQAILAGFKSGDAALVQYGLKGLYKSKTLIGHDDNKLRIFDILQDVYVGTHPNKFKYSDEEATKLRDLILKRIRIMGDVKYHELNAFADLLCGEPYTAGLLSQVSRKRILRSKYPYELQFWSIKQIPLYAQDNHTWSGKALMKKHAIQLERGAVQRDIDFRWCGAYFGVAWRLLAFAQHGTCDVKWGDVNWPDWLYNHTRKMFY